LGEKWKAKGNNPNKKRRIPGHLTKQDPLIARNCHHNQVTLCRWNCSLENRLQRDHVATLQAPGRIIEDKVWSKSWIWWKTEEYSWIWTSKIQESYCRSGED